MADSYRSKYTIQVSGLWNKRHTVFDEEGKKLGVLTAKRNPWGMVVSAEYRPEEGEVLSISRDPGLLRAQFSIWTEGKEWLGSSLRWSSFRRQVDMWTGTKPLRVVPRTGFGAGWRLVAAKTGESARIESGLFGRKHVLYTFRKLDFELLLFAHFLGSLSNLGSFLPTSLDNTGANSKQPAASRA
ncbi:MAG: hypothetical protein ACI841_001931 [Planctomycetota bacterium]|jgi:hypothetical protein